SRPSFLQSVGLEGDCKSKANATTVRSPVAVCSLPIRPPRIITRGCPYERTLPRHRAVQLRSAPSLHFSDQIANEPVHFGEQAPFLLLESSGHSTCVRRTARVL